MWHVRWHEAPGNSLVRRPTTCGYCGLDLERSGDASEESGAVWIVLGVFVHGFTWRCLFIATGNSSLLSEQQLVCHASLNLVLWAQRTCMLTSSLCSSLTSPPLGSSPHPCTELGGRRPQGRPSVRVSAPGLRSKQSSPPRNCQSWRRQVRSNTEWDAKMEQTKGSSPPNTSPKRTQPASWSLLTSRQRSRSCVGATCTSSGNMIQTWPRSSTDGTRAPPRTACIMTLPTRTSRPAAESIKGVHCHRAVLQLRMTPYRGSSSRKITVCSTAAPSSGHIWTIGTSGSSRNTSRQPSRVSGIPL